MILEKGDPIGEKGRWAAVWMGGTLTAKVSCPRCGVAGTLVPEVNVGHVVHADGSVTPSLVCPNKDCAFHEYVELRDWDPDATNNG